MDSGEGWRLGKPGIVLVGAPRKAPPSRHIEICEVTSGYVAAKGSVPLRFLSHCKWEPDVRTNRSRDLREDDYGHDDEQHDKDARDGVPPPLHSLNPFAFSA